MTQKQTTLSLQESVAGCWLGKSIGGTIGLSAEGDIGPLNFTYYDPVPTIAPPNDDLELQLVWLHLLEQKGFELTQEDFRQAWIDHIHYMWDEYGRCRWNLRRGVPTAAVGTFENWFGSSMGSPIRSEIWAILCAGKPEHAAAYARLDASLDHGREGIAGEVFLAVLQSLILDNVELRNALRRALEAIDPQSETAKALQLAFDLHAHGHREWNAYHEIVATHGQENFTHAPLNLALIGWALLYGDGDFDKSLLLGTNCGYDTDCTAATVGATLGMMIGPEGIDERWKTPIGDGVFIGPGIIGIQAAETLADLTDRTLKLQKKFAKQSLTPLPALPAIPVVNLNDLPGTIGILPRGETSPVPWANGELPREVLEAGGAEWTWTVGPESRNGCRFVALAREGCRFYLDEQLILDCPTESEFVPAVHRPIQEAKTIFQPSQASYRVRLELNSRSADQEASAYIGLPNYHITTWDGSVLPHAATLPAPEPKVASNDQ
ncbi:ADP-ribosylglycohydrolase family protein [Puniceicoccus vermicola]|uniref:ADP-ribosylglycohydrolase family protein n=1 Tax=Puniceicoccus vermicola TaxID=388746 RepID=A0A7X1E771_9BACT|nr:ADP-ribosylglycohydrolase family protein [Puniceicoccus vermicola]MBC2603412.1 ADP-ribosylglycohydrolase family protein [Puniceicoccus vermicola]